MRAKATAAAAVGRALLALVAFCTAASTVYLINDLRDDVYYARIVVDVNGRRLEIDARPSDAVALAVRVHVPVFVAETVMLEVADRPRPEQVPEPGHTLLGLYEGVPLVERHADSTLLLPDRITLFRDSDRVAVQNEITEIFSEVRHWALLVGTDLSNGILAHQIQSRSDLSYRVRGLLATDETDKGARLGQIPILGKVDDAVLR